MSDFTELHATVCGNVGSFDLKFTQSGTTYLSISIATEHWDTQHKQSTTAWNRVVLFGVNAERISKMLYKGCKVSSHGTAQVKTYINKDGEFRAALNIIAQKVTILSKQSDNREGNAGYDSRPVAQASQFGQHQPPAQPTQFQAPVPPKPFDNFDDDIPF